MAGEVPDWLLDVRTWLRAHPDLAPLHGGRVFFEVPNSGVGYPLCRVYASGGPTMVPGGDVPLFDCRLAVEVWGSGRKMYQQVRQLAAAVAAAVWGLQPGPLDPSPAGTAYCGGGYVGGTPDVPDPDQGDPRYVIDAVLTIRTRGAGDP